MKTFFVSSIKIPEYCKLFYSKERFNNEKLLIEILILFITLTVIKLFLSDELKIVEFISFVPIDFSK